MLRGSGSGKVILEVSGRVILEKRISLTAEIASSLVIDSLCDQARKEDIAVAWLYCDYNTQKVPGGYTEGIPGREKAATCRYDANVEDSDCFVTTSFHLYRCAR